MPSINFTMFIEAVENGIAQANGQPLPHHGVRPKRQTIRAVRKVPIKVGDALHLFTGMRTPKCRRLGAAICVSAWPVTIWNAANGRFISASSETIYQIRDDGWDWETHLAVADGFDDEKSMLEWFVRTHRITSQPWNGRVTRW